MSSGTSVEGVYFFCTCDLDVAKRHELQDWARNTHSVSLEIFDGAGMSELLAEPDLFWLSERYLQLPSELFPAVSTEAAQDWYSRTLSKWRKSSHPARSFADFSEIRRAARRALGPMEADEQGKPATGYKLPELPFWIERLDEIAANDTGGLLRRRALYEASVARLRGLGSLIGQEAVLRLYFAQVPQLEDGADLEDAGVLLSYMVTARVLGQVELEENEVNAWEVALERRLDEQIAKAKREDKTNQRCALLNTRAFVSLWKRRHEGIVDATTAIAYWKKLVMLIPRAPLFPLEHFADNLAKFAQFIGSHPEYDALAESVDALVAQRFGQIKAAEKCVARAKAFRNNGDLPRAMAQIHRAKVDWYAEETLEQSLWAMSWLSYAYNTQGLHFAAKYYALAAAFLALHSPGLEIKSKITPQLLSAAECDFRMGAWHGFLELARSAMAFYANFARDLNRDLSDPDGPLNHLIYYLALISVLSERLQPDIVPFAEAGSASIIEKLGLKDVMDEIRPTAQEAWGKYSVDKLWATIEEDLAGVPWSDAGTTCRCEWSAHGVRWQTEWENNYTTTLLAEEFLSALQIFLSELAGRDLCLLRCSINMTIRVASTSEATAGFKGFDLKSKPSNASREVVVRLPPMEHFKEGRISQRDLQAGALSVVSALLAEVSLLPSKRYNEILSALFEGGLPHKLLVGAPYHQCLGEFVTSDEFAASARCDKAQLNAPASFAIRASDELPWFDGPGPKRDSFSLQDVLEKRYEKFTRPISRTLARLNADPEWRNTVQRLQGEGWKDWHLLSVVFHGVMNYRMNQRRTVFSRPQLEMDANRQMMQQEEPENAPPVPLSEFSEEKIRNQMSIYMLAVLQNYGLETHQATPDFEGVADFLTHRYNFWNDDIEHADPFDFSNTSRDAPVQSSETSKE